MNGASGCRPDRADEAGCREIESLDKCVNDPDERLRSNIVVYGGGGSRLG